MAVESSWEVWAGMYAKREKKRKAKYEDEEDEPPIQIVRTAKKPKKKDQ